MSESLILSQGLSKKERYEELIPQIKALLEGEDDLIANMANVASVLKEGFGFLWVGFYRMVNEELVLGPFQGPLACTRIALGRGVCGAAARQQETIVVPDVDAFPGHIACSSLSRSEIVIPKVKEGITHWVMDVDSDRLNDFSEVDQQFLEVLVEFM